MKFTELIDFLNNKIPINLFYKNIKNEIDIYRNNFINKNHLYLLLLIINMKISSTLNQYI
jgi:hypothetical protein